MDSFNRRIKELKESMKLNLFAATTVLALLTTAAYAQYIPVGNDGVTASPRLRQMLNEKPAKAPAVAAKTEGMRCSKCVDVATSRTPANAKGAEVATGVKQVRYHHGCPSCETQLTVVGEGKAKQTVALHSCSMLASKSPGCCAAK